MHPARIFISAVLLALVFCVAPGVASAQSAPQPTPVAKGNEPAEIVRSAVAREFGPHFTLSPKFQPMFGDFDGDGTEDLAVVVTGEPMLAMGEYKYKLIDPYDGYFGYGNARTMMAFSVNPDEHPLLVLIAHDWRAAHAKAKFVIVNLPFTDIQVTSGTLKKKTVSTLFTRDTTGVQALVFWDGRKYRWEGVGAE